MKTIYSSGSGSSSHIYGNVASLIKELLKSQFPKNFFNHIYISTESVTREITPDLVNSDTEFVKNSNPVLAINPRFDFTNEDLFLYGSFLTSNYGGMESAVSKKQLMPVLEDHKKNIELRYKMNCDRIVFEITIFVDTSHAQLDLYKDIQNKFDWRKHFFVNSSLESMIPRSMIGYLAKLQGWDIEDPASSPLIVRYLNEHSKYPITYKMRGSTSLDEYFMYYNTRILCSLSELSLEDGSKKDYADDYYPIRFTFTTEFNLPVQYFLLGDINNRIDFNFDIVLSDRNSNELIPIYTIYKAFESPYEDSNLKVHSNLIFDTDVEDGEDDTLDLSQLFNPDVIKIINQHIAANLDLGIFIKIKVCKDREELIEGKDWEINWLSQMITIRKTTKSATYRLITYVNFVYLNSKLADLHDSFEYDNGLPEHTEPDGI